MGKIARFVKLPRAEKKLVLLMVPYLVRSVLRLKVRGFTHSHDSYPIKHSTTSSVVCTKELEALGLAIGRVSNTLKIGTCLSRSLALRDYLARRGIVTSLRIGVRKPDGVLKAHAWLEYQGTPIGEKIPGVYSVLPEFI